MQLIADLKEASKKFIQFVFYSSFVTQDIAFATHMIFQSQIIISAFFCNFT